MLTRKTLAKVLGVAVATVLASAPLAADTRRPSPLRQAQGGPNILFILVDDMGWRDLGVYGNKIHETPNIDGLATGGMRFTDAYAACPICGPSRASIMTGKFPSRTGFVDNYISSMKGMKLSRSPNRQFMKLEEFTLAEALKAGGYQTGFVGKWHLTADNESRLPTDQGFDVNVAGGWWGHPRGRTGYFSPYGMAHLKDGPKGEYLTDRLTTEAIRVMDDFSQKERPWLLYMSYYTVHSPFHSKPEKTRKYTEEAREAGIGKFNAKYAGMVESLDENVGRLLQWLDRKGLRENTVVIFTSDNGGHRPATENRPLRGHKGDLYEGGIRVPCIIDWPGVIKPGTVCSAPVHGVDYYATLLAMAGLPPRPENHQDSVSLVPLLKGDTTFDRGPMVWHYPVAKPITPQSKPGSVIRVGDWKFIQYYEDGRQELYNLKRDIGEADNLAKRMPEKAAEMKAQLGALLKEHGAKVPTPAAARKPPATPARGRTRKPLGKTGDLTGPFAVHLHCGDGKQTGELLEREGVVVQGLDTSRKNVEAARRNPAFRTEYGKRITFKWFDGKNLPYIDNCVNVIRSAGPVAVSPEEILRVLAPGGIATFRAAEAPKVSEQLATVKRVKRGRYDGHWRLQKLWPSDIDEWTHHMHGPDNNRVSRDTRLAAPLSHLQWTAGPRFTRHHEHMSSFQAMVSARGKVFYIIDEGSKDTVLLPPDWNLVARDAFNGIVLWRKKLDHWFNHMWPFKSGPVVVTRRLVVKGDRLFAALEMGGGVSVLDANTGALLHELGGTEGAEEIIVEGERLFVAKRQWLVEADKYNVKTKVTSGGTAARMTRNFSWNTAAGRQQVTAFDLATRKQLWQKETPVAPFGLGARNGNVYVFDGQQVLSLKARSGQVNWTSPEFSKARVPFSTGAGCSLVCGEERILLGTAASKNMVALSTKDGTVVWQGEQYRSGRHSAKDLFLIDGTAWTAATLGSSMTLPGVPSTAKRKSGRITGYNLDDGKQVADFYTDSDVYIMNSRCHMSCATANYLITSRTGAELVSLREKKWNLHHWLRGACLYGLMPANGMLYAPPNPCACYTQSSLDGFNAVTGHSTGWQRVVEKQEANDFVRGSALPAEQVGQAGEIETQAWPVYRHDNRRSGSTPVKVALPLAVTWRAQGHENLTSLVVANGRCVFAEKDRHTVHCLDAKSGKAQWSYVAGGRIDSPPAVSGNSLYFGCADGWLYRLLVSSGELVWKRRIAPAEISLFDHGQPASVWPLSGSVLVQGGKVYCVAGRSSFLDGGMRLTVVDAETGEVLNENVMDHLDPDNRKDMHQHVAMQNMPVSLPDLLSSDGKHLYMRSQQFDLEGKRTHIKNSGWDDDIEIGIGREHLFSPTGFLDDNWFHRTYWVYGNSFLEGCSVPSGGWFEMGRISPSGKMLCFDDTTVYGYGQFPEYSKWSTPLRYSLFAVNKKPRSYQPGVPDEQLRKTRPNWRKYRTLRAPKVEFDVNWRNTVPLRAKAIVKTPAMLLVAGPEDILDEEEVFQDARSEANQKSLQKQNELIHSRQSGKLLAVSVKDGSAQQMVDLGSQPVWDGMAVAYGNLFMCTRDGSVVAFETSNDPSLMLKRSPPVARKAEPKETDILPGKASALKAMGGRIAEVSSFNRGREAKNMLDGDLSTFWHTRFKPDLAKPPHYVVLQVPGTKPVRGLSYYAWAGNGNGHLKGCSVYVSDDGKNWGKPLVKQAVLKPKVHTEQQILFPAPTKKRFIKLEVTDAVSRGGRPLAAIGELDVLVE